MNKNHDQMCNDEQDNLKTGVIGIIEHNRNYLKSLLHEYRSFSKSELEINKLINNNIVLTTNQELLRNACADTKIIIKDSTDKNAIKAHKAAKEAFAAWCLLYCELVLAGKYRDYKLRNSQDMVSAATDAYLQTMEELRDEINDHFRNTTDKKFYHQKDSKSENQPDGKSKKFGFRSCMAKFLNQEYGMNLNGQVSVEDDNGQIKKKRKEHGDLIKVEKAIEDVNAYVKKDFKIIDGQEYDTWAVREKNRAKNIIIQRGDEYFILKKESRFTSLYHENSDGNYDFAPEVADEIMRDAKRFREKYFAVIKVNNTLSSMLRRNKINDFELELLNRCYLKGEEKLSDIKRDWEKREIPTAHKIYDLHKKLLAKLEEELKE